jgi:hypothetical protein
MSKSRGFCRQPADRPETRDMATRPNVHPLPLDMGHLFSERLLGECPDCFADRTAETKRLRLVAERSRILAVEGPLGSGKSALLRHFANQQLMPHHPTAFLHLSAMSHTRLYRRMLKEVLLLCFARRPEVRLTLSQKKRVDLHRASARMECSLREDTGFLIEAGAEGFKAALERKQSRAVQPYDEAAALEVLEQIAQSSTKRFFLVLDDFHYLRMTDGGESYLADLSALVSVISQRFEDSKMTVIVTLDDKAAQQRRKLQAERSGTWLMMADDIVRVSSFGLNQIAEMIFRRLGRMTPRVGLSEFITQDGMVGLFLASGGNPRAILQLLRTADDAARAVEKGYPLTLQGIKAAADEVDLGHLLGNSDVAILGRIRKGGFSPSQADVAASFGTSRSTLGRCLRDLADRGALYAQKKGKASRQVYNLATWENAFE